MDYFTAFWLALVQGITEFLPISSQAHLVLAGQWLGDVYQGLAFDVVLHAGSLVAVIAYFRHEIFTMLRDWFGTWLGKGATKDSKLGWWVIIGTIPAGVLGILFKDLAEGVLRGEVIMGLALIVFGLLLGLADWKGRGDRDEYSLGLRDVLIIGFAQALALIPGTSRSGITMTAALFLGLSRDAAARFSFLLSIPIIAAASLLLTFDLVREGTDIPWDTLLVGFVVAAVSTYACIHYFLAFIRRIGMQPFVIYRLILGGLLLWFFL
ncbi:undecaprenyl-diphosphate phosphatase [Aliidiomarina haloalkalitolerans]|uniref:Undecaprenyl-diphosphatase n=1 Tax=Aliidiomarina haloalkalitolerans TaxID=859059 RepID=A0A432VRY1_9GAMM|nr:undecaprenyl-diphosphate phosphatase [Aliidiomarina haloalkalitolerans]RUO19107.1 undecaprenyl-diphosphatase [Aliidiomarina haloalkalitolerans]